MDINPKHLDAALNVLGVTMNIPLNTLVFNLHNALQASADNAAGEAYQRGYIDAMNEAEDDIEQAYEAGRDFGVCEGRARGEAEVDAVAEEVYEDGYIDAVHDFKNCPDAAIEQADAFEHDRDLMAAVLSMDPTING